jgi:cytochrome c553
MVPLVRLSFANVQYVLLVTHPTSRYSMKRLKTVIFITKYYFELNKIVHKDHLQSTLPMSGVTPMFGNVDVPVTHEFQSLNRDKFNSSLQSDYQAELYATNCASCHGNDDMGDGPAASALNPPPAPLAHTSQTTGDDYLFWRISEGGIPFNTSMPPWKVLDEEARWDPFNYLRTLDPAVQRSP